MQYLFVGFVTFVTFSALAVEPLRLLETSDAWVRVEGVEDSFVFDSGTLRVERGGAEPAELLTQDDFENFDLTFEFTVGRWTESGFYFLAPRNRAYRAGLELELADSAATSPSDYGPGALFGKVAPLALPMRAHNEWNTCQIRLAWPRLVISMNGVLIHDLDLEAHESTRYLPRRGAIGFQNLGYAMTVRNFALTPLPDTEHGIVMLNDNDLEGWEQVRGNARWVIEDGVLRSSGPDGYLRHETRCQDFDFRGYIRAGFDANGGIFIRWPSGEPVDRADRGHEIQILDLVGSASPTGSIYGFARANDLALWPGQWQFLQIFVRGGHCVTVLNGVKAAEYDGLPIVRAGHIALQMHRAPWVEYKDLVLVPKDGLGSGP